MAKQASYKNTPENLSFRSHLSSSLTKTPQRESERERESRERKMGVLGVMSGSDSRRRKKVSKLKTQLSLATARLSVLKSHHQARRSAARADVAQLLLQLGRDHHADSALLRAEAAAKEDDMLDALALVHSYCHLLTDRASLLLQQKGCPDELKEAVSSLIYASTRSGEMPELQVVCGLFSSMFGREFVSAATELRNCCGVNPKIVQKLSTKQPSLESRVKIIKEIAAEKGIPLDFTEDEPLEKEDLRAHTQNKKQSSTTGAGLTRDSSSVSSVHNYKDVASAAQAAFEKAEDAAAAARAAVELTRSSHSPDDDHDSERRSYLQEKKVKGTDEDPNFANVKVYYSEDSSSESEDEINGTSNIEFMQGPRTFSASAKEDKPKIFGSWALKGDRKNMLLSTSRSETGTNYEENDAGSYDRPTAHEEISASSLESDTMEIVGDALCDNLDKHYFGRESPFRQPKVGDKPVSVRTRRGMMK